MRLNIYIHVAVLLMTGRRDPSVHFLPTVRWEVMINMPPATCSKPGLSFSDDRDIDLNVHYTQLAGKRDVYPQHAAATQ